MPVVTLNEQSFIYRELARAIHGRAHFFSDAGISSLKDGLVSRFGFMLGEQHQMLVDSLIELACHHHATAGLNTS